MPQNTKACVRMEEGYMRATINYKDIAYKTIVNDAIANLENSLQIHPEVIQREDSSSTGYITVEFSGEDYICNRNSGKFIQQLLNDLDISECEA